MSKDMGLHNVLASSPGREWMLRHLEDMGFGQVITATDPTMLGLAVGRLNGAQQLVRELRANHGSDFVEMLREDNERQANARANAEQAAKASKADQPARQP